MKDPGSNKAPFPPTRWTLVQRIQEGDEEEATQAFSDFCERYWSPVYAFLRRSGKSPEDAEDCAQMFFEQLIRDKTLMSVRQQKGKLRTFLLAALKRMLSKRSRYEKARKRGGDQLHFSLSHIDFEQGYQAEFTDAGDPEQIYLKAWAGSLLHSVRSRLKEEFAKNGKESLFEILDPYLCNDVNQPPYEQIAREMDSSAGAVRLLVHRLRKRFRGALEDEIRETVSSPEEVAGELEWLKRVLAQSAS